MSLVSRRKGQGMSIYSCDNCDNTGRWGDYDWRTWGSINDLDDGKEQHYCSDDCMVKQQGKKSLTMILDLDQYN
ncbi:MAG: hypothetical protein ACR2MX_01680 [Cyclobacteriaceae bacterium]